MRNLNEPRFANIAAALKAGYRIPTWDERPDSGGYGCVDAATGQESVTVFLEDLAGFHPAGPNTEAWPNGWECGHAADITCDCFHHVELFAPPSASTTLSLTSVDADVVIEALRMLNYACIRYAHNSRLNLRLDLHPSPLEGYCIDTRMVDGTFRGLATRAYQLMDAVGTARYEDPEPGPYPAPPAPPPLYKRSELVCYNLGDIAGRGRINKAVHDNPCDPWSYHIEDLAVRGRHHPYATPAAGGKWCITIKENFLSLVPHCSE